MQGYINYELIDTHHFDNHHYIKVKRIDDATVPNSHYIVAQYLHSRTTGSNEMISCEHFIGETAEIDALNYFLGYAEPASFKKLPATSFKSNKPWLSYTKTKKEEE